MEWVLVSLWIAGGICLPDTGYTGMARVPPPLAPGCQSTVEVQVIAEFVEQDQCVDSIYWLEIKYREIMLKKALGATKVLKLDAYDRRQEFKKIYPNFIDIRCLKK